MLRPAGDKLKVNGGAHEHLKHFYGSAEHDVTEIQAVPYPHLDNLISLVKSMALFVFFIVHTRD